MGMPEHAEPTEFVQKHNHSRLRNLSRRLARHHNETHDNETHDDHEHDEHDHDEHEHAEHEHDDEPTEFLQKHDLKNLTRHAEHAEHEHDDEEHAEEEAEHDEAKP